MVVFPQVGPCLGLVRARRFVLHGALCYVALCATWRFVLRGALCRVAPPGRRFPGLPMRRFLPRKRHIGRAAVQVQIR